MHSVTIEVPDTLFKKLPKKQQDLKKILKTGLEALTSNKQNSINVVDETFGALPVKKNKLIEQIIEQVKYEE